MVLMLVVAVAILVVNLYGVSFRAETIVGVEKSLVFLGADSSFLGMTKAWIFLSIGFLLSIAGLIFETIADIQLREFIQIKKP
jgi:hypothetical protein